MSGRPFPALQDFRVTQGGKLTLFLKQGDTCFTRCLKLGAESGPLCYLPDGRMHFARGYAKKPSFSPLMTRSDGLRGRLVYHKDKHPFMVRASRELCERVEAEVWPVMALDPNRRPPAYFREAVQEGVQPFPRAA